MMSRDTKDSVSLSSAHYAVLERLDHLRKSEQLFHGAWEDNPRPCWYKWVRGGQLVMGRVNAAYTQATGITVEAYKGEEDDSLWHGKHAFNEADREVVRSRVRVKIAELATNPLTGKVQYWVGWKWPQIERGEVVGIWGEAISVPQEIYDEFRELIDFVVFKDA